MSDKGWRVGEVWEPELHVVSDKTGEPLNAPSIAVIVTAPDRSEAVVTAPKAGIGIFVPSIELTSVGEWKAVAKTPGPYQGVGVETVYAEPT
jgi:hypothetical protein